MHGQRAGGGGVLKSCIQLLPAPSQLVASCCSASLRVFIALYICIPTPLCVIIQDGKALERGAKNAKGLSSPLTPPHPALPKKDAETSPGEISLLGLPNPHPESIYGHLRHSSLTRELQKWKRWDAAEDQRQV